MVAGPISGRLADRIGPRSLMTGGLVAVSASMFWLSGITTHSSYGFLAVSFVLMGLGIGFVMSPMTTAAMNSVDRTKAGVASGILNMTRMIGSTFGVAALGAIIATVGSSQLATRLPHASGSERTRLVELLGSGASTSRLPGHVQAALNETYVSALSKGLYVLGGLALAGALLSWMLVARRPAPEPAYGSEERAVSPERAISPQPAVSGERAEGAAAEVVRA
jgi:MFS family permease